MHNFECRSDCVKVADIILVSRFKTKIKIKINQEVKKH